MYGIIYWYTCIYIYIVASYVLLFSKSLFDQHGFEEEAY